MCCLGEQHLATMRSGGDPCGAMDIDSYVAYCADLRLACMQTHAYAEADIVHPRRGSECTLGLHDSLERIDGAWKSNKEGISLAIYHATIVHLARLTQKPLLLRE